MATTYKCVHDGTEIKVRRLLWKEVKEIRKKAKETDGEARMDDLDFTEEVVKKVIEPKSAIDKLDVTEVKKIFDYAFGAREELD